MVAVADRMHNAHWLGHALDWYGIDIYDGQDFQRPNGLLNRSAILGRLDQNLHAWREAAGEQAVSVRITETNSAHDNHRKNWMLFLSEWMAANNGYRVITSGAASCPGPGRRAAQCAANTAPCSIATAPESRSAVDFGACPRLKQERWLRPDRSARRPSHARPAGVSVTPENWI